jgi:leucyl aminopeptidase
MMIAVRIEVTPALDSRAAVVAVGIRSAGWAIEDVGLPLDAAAALRTYLDASATSAAPARLATPGSIERLALAAQAPRLIYLVGLGQAGPDEIRAAAAGLARAARADAIDALSVAFGSLPADASAALAEGLILGGYRFRAGLPPARPVRSARSRRSAVPGELVVGLVGADRAGVEHGRAVASATAWARELANTRSSTKTPVWLARQAELGLASRGVEVTVRDVDWLTANGFGGVLAVGGGSSASPRLIEASWRPRGARAGCHVVLVGKSITYDSGGINIKPLDSMTSMYTDMSGGAAVLGTLRLIADLELPIRVTGLLPAAENSVSGSAMRQTDVIRHFGGRTTEVGNTDAEGRLVLADALAYAAARLKPTVMVDLATLTGAMKVALGLRVGGLFSSDDDLAAALVAAGAASGEPLWRLPLAAVYESALHSDIADANNSPGNPGGIAAALFLRPFAGSVPWAHLDIAGPARAGEDDGELSIGATGFGVRLLGEWLRRLAAG